MSGWVCNRSILPGISVNKQGSLCGGPDIAVPQSPSVQKHSCLFSGMLSLPDRLLSEALVTGEPVI